MGEDMKERSEGMFDWKVRTYMLNENKRGPRRLDALPRLKRGQTGWKEKISMGGTESVNVHRDKGSSLYCTELSEP